MAWMIVSDSSCEIRELERPAPGVQFALVPFKIRVGEREYVDLPTLNTHQMLQAMTDYNGARTTACPSPEEWAEYFLQADNVFAFTISSNLSGSYNAACVGRDIALAEKTGCRYHVCHVSTKESVELVRRARAKGLRVSCETAPHYLLLCDEDLQEEGRFKMNPPLRSRADREALVAGIADGTIEVVATDHAPHTAEEKSRGLAGSAMGIVGLETAFPLLYKYLVLPGTISLERLFDLMSKNPRRIFGLEGGVEAGDPADFTVLDLGAQYRVDPETFLSKGRATPFAGWEVQGRAVLTVVGGKEVYDEMKVEN